MKATIEVARRALGRVGARGLFATPVEFMRLLADDLCLTEWSLQPVSVRQTC
jgi:hypothetical protein